MLKKDIRLVKATVGGRHYTAWHVAAERGHVCVLEELLAAVLDCKEAVEQLNNSLRYVIGHSVYRDPVQLMLLRLW